jgi:allophanate hydrolase
MPHAEHYSFVVSGNHMQGLSKNEELRQLGGSYVATLRTASTYRFVAWGDRQGKPALVRTTDEYASAAGILVEEWRLPASGVLGLLAETSPPQGMGYIQLADGRQVLGFTVESYALADARDITDLGDWRVYLAHAGKTLHA